MTSAVLAQPQFWVYETPGESGDAKILDEIFKGIEKHRLNNAVSSDKQTKLESIYREAKLPDWDGHSSLPADPRSYHQAKTFLNLLSDWVPTPEFSVDPDGEISLEWYYSRSRLISISIGPDGSLTYIGFLGSVRMKGVEYLDKKIPNAIATVFSRIIPRNA